MTPIIEMTPVITNAFVANLQSFDYVSLLQNNEWVLLFVLVPFIRQIVEGLKNVKSLKGKGQAVSIVTTAIVVILFGLLKAELSAIDSEFLAIGVFVKYICQTGLATMSANKLHDTLKNNK